MKRLVMLGVVLLVVPWLAVVGIAAAFAGTAATGDQATGCLPSSGSDVAGVAVPVGASTTLQGPRLAATVAYKAGFRGEDLVIAVAVAGAESSYDPLVRNSIGASGLWQILQRVHQDLFARYDWRQPADNAAMAFSVFTAAGRSWLPWTTWTSGAYLSHLAGARSAVAALGLGALQARGSAATTFGSAAPAVPVACLASAPGGAAPAPFMGGVGFVPDPSGTGGRVTLALGHLMTEVDAKFGQLPVSCWSARGGDPYSDHPKGKACDYTMGHIGSYATGADLSRGWKLAFWLRQNNMALNVNYVIWQGRIWSRAHDVEGWRPYTGGGIYPSTGPTFGHFDHLHVSVL